MRSVCTAGACAATIALLAGTGFAQQPPLALSGATVVDVRSGRLVTNQTIVIAGNRIVAVGPPNATRIPGGARMIDARTKFVIPGLWDMHVHSAAAATREFPLYVALGVTGIRNMHTTVDTALALVSALERAVAAGTLIGPRLIANGATIDGPQPVQQGSVRVRDAESARRAADSLVAGGADFLKVYIRLPRDAYFALAEQAKKHRVPLVGHVPLSIRAEEAADAGQKSFEHSDVLDWACSPKGDSIRTAFLADPAPNLMKYRRARAEVTMTWTAAHCRPAIAALVRNGTWVVPTLVVAWGPVAPDSALADSSARAVTPTPTLAQWRTDNADVPPEAKRIWAAEVRTGVELVRLLHAAGVPLLAGTDVGNPFVVAGYSLHRELEMLVGAGLTPLAALQAATVNPARFLGAADSLGTVEAGKVADLVVLDANPLTSIRNTRRINAVFANGRYFDRAAIDGLIRSAARAANPSTKP